MSARELVFDILAIDRASAVFDKVGGKAEAMGGRVKSGSKLMEGALLGAGLAIAAVAVDSLKTATEMESKMTKLTTTAGESSSGMKTAWAGIDEMAGQVGYSVQNLGDAMYYVESGGYHGATGLKVLGDAARSAKVENANVVDVAKALTGALNDYKGTSLTSAEAANVLTAAVGHGMMTYQDLADALPHIGSRAAAAKVTFEELTGAMATMTQDGLPARVAATYLGQTIGQLAAPTAKAATEMKGLGLNATDVSLALTSGSGHGLYDAIKMIDDAITRHLSPSGLVAVEAFKKSKGSASDFQKMLANLPPEMQTSVQAIATMAGGVKGMQGMLLLGGNHLATFKGNVQAMNDQVHAGNGQIAGFSAQQKTLNGILDDAKGRWSGLADSLGQKMLPAAKGAAEKLGALLGWMTQHSDAVIRFAGVIGGLAVAVKTYTAIQVLCNLAMDANPIGLIILGLAALTVAFVYAYTTSDTFRKVVVVVLDVIQAAFWVLAQVAVTTITVIIDIFLELVSHLLDGAALAFGWIPGLGPKLKGAATAFDHFKDDTNTALAKVKNNIDVHIKTAEAAAQYDTLIAQMQTPVTIPVFLNTQYAAGSVNVAGVGKVNAGMRAAGGPVEAGMTYRVGENGPENVTFGSPGYVHDAKTTKAGSGGGGGIHIEHYHEGSKSGALLAGDLMFKLAHS